MEILFRKLGTLSLKQLSIIGFSSLVLASMLFPGKTEVPKESLPPQVTEAKVESAVRTPEAAQALAEELTPIYEDPEPSEVGVVKEVVDGDTIKVNVAGKASIVRLLGINAPEGGACLAKRSKSTLSSLILNQEVSLFKDDTQDNKDKSGRLLRYVELGYDQINEEMIRQGLAKEYTYNSSNPYEFQSSFVIAQTSAKEEELNIWGPDCACKKGEVSRKCVACNQASVTYRRYDCSTFTKKVTDYKCSNKCVTYTAPKPKAPSYTCSCSKTCSQMSSCQEAYYQLNTCGCTRRDGDGDGVPCESICPGG